MSTWLAAAGAVAAIAVTYVCCIRPMWRRHGGCGGRDAEQDRQIAELREELRILRAQDALDARE